MQSGQSSPQRVVKRHWYTIDIIVIDIALYNSSIIIIIITVIINTLIKKKHEICKQASP